jgi:hypothetical protein
MNPLLAYFVAGEQAMLETLVLVQAHHGHHDSAQTTAVLELKHVLVQVARREIEAFCAVCQHRRQRAAEHPAPALRR